MKTQGEDGGGCIAIKKEGTEERNKCKDRISHRDEK